MGYRIHYGKTMQTETFIDNRKNRVGLSIHKWITALLILLGLTFLTKAGCIDFLIPGDKAVTKQAFSAMVEDVSGGVDVETAFTAFCREILDGAKSPC